jgi:hypothetical protein
MPLKIAPEDRKLLVVFIVLLASMLLLVGLVIHTDGGTGVLPTSYSSANSGAKAAFLLLEQMGYAPRRWNNNPRQLDALPPNATLILAEPIAVEDQDLEVVRRFVNKGGHVLVTGAGGQLLFPKRSMRVGLPHFQWKSYRPAEPSDLARGIDEIVMAPQFYFDSSHGETPFVDGDERPITRFSYGAGEVIWWSSSDPLTNSGIREKDNARLLLNSVGEPGERLLFWDEYFHQNGKTVTDSIFESPLRWGVLQLALIGTVVVFTFSRQFGPYRESVALPRTAPMEYVETMAALYHRAGATSIPVEVVYERFRAGLQRRYAVRTDATTEQIAQTIVDHIRGSADLSQVTNTLREIEASTDHPGFKLARATALVRQLHEWNSRLK